MLSTCPAEQDLLAFHRGTLHERQVDTVAEHLEACADCEATIRRFDQRVDPLVDVMRKHIQGNSSLRSGDWPPRNDSQARLENAGSELGPAAWENWPKLPGYEIVAVLGRGGMGVVYEARHLALGRSVALKHLQTGTGSLLARSRLEAHALAGLHHPNIVQIHEIVEHDGSLFLSLELVKGGSLAAHMRGKPRPALETARLLETVARAVQHAHERGIIHRDLKPANILLSNESVAESGAGGNPASGSDTGHSALVACVPKIADFGLAKRMAAPEGATRDGDIIGTPSYMAPEQAAAKPESIGPATDIYGLGVILYEMLTGRVPLQGVNTLETLFLVCESDPVPPRRIQPRLARDLETICLKCLEKDPGRRYRSATDLAEDLRRFRENEPIVARPTPLWERGWKWVRRRPALAGLLILSLGVLMVGFPLVLFLWLRADRALVQVEHARNQLESAVYAGNINLADHEVHATHFNSARSFLDRCMPASGRPDLRGWDWHYLHRLCHADLFPGMKHGENGAFWVFALSFHPNNKYLVSCAGLPAGALAGRPPNAHEFTPGEAKVWDVSTGRCLRTLIGHNASIQSAAFSPDGRWLATGAVDGTVLLWDGETFARHSSIPSQTGQVTGLTFSPDSRFLAVGSAKSIRLWDLTRERCQYVFTQHAEGRTLALAFSPDGHRLAAGLKTGHGNSLEIWDLGTGLPFAHHVGPGPIAALAFSPDGRFLALADGRERLEIWNADLSRLTRRLSGHSEGISTLVFCPNGHLVSGGEDRTVRVWNPDSGTVETEYGGHELGILCVAVSSDGARLASADKLGSVEVWDLRENPRGVSFNALQGNGEYLGQLAFSADGRKILEVVDVPDAPDHYLEVRDAATGRLERRLTLARRSETDHSHRLFAFSRDARRLCGLDWADHSTAVSYDTQDGSEIGRFSTPGVEITAIAMSHDGKQIAQSGWKVVRGGPKPTLRTELSVRDATTGRLLRSLRLPSMHVATQLAFSPDGQRLATSVREGAFQDGQLTPLSRTDVYFWDIARRAEPLVLDIRHDGALTCLAFSPDGTRLVSVGVDQRVQVVDSTTGRAIFPATTTSGTPTSVIFSPDGRRLAAAGMDGIVRMWDATSGNALLSLRGLGPPGGGHYGFTARLAFSPDGSRLASNDWDGTVTIFTSHKVVSHPRD